MQNFHKAQDNFIIFQKLPRLTALAILLFAFASTGFAQVQKFFVADGGAPKAIYRYNESVAATTNWSTDALNADPQDVVVTNSNVFVLNGATKQVFRYSYDGTLPAVASGTLLNNTGVALGTVTGMAIDGDELWISDQPNKRILIYSLKAAFENSTLNATRQFTMTANNTDCYGLMLDATNVYALDKVDHVFYRYPRNLANNATGTNDPSKPLRDAGNSNLTAPVGAALESGVVWVVNATVGAVDTISRYNITTMSDLFGGGNAKADNTYNLPTANTNSTGIGVNPAPAVSSIARVAATPTNAATVAFTVVFSEPVSGVDTGDFTLTTTGVSGTSVASVDANSGTTFTVTVNTGSGSGTIRLDFTDNNSVVDIGNLPVGGASGNGNFTTGPSYTIDKTGPTASASVTGSPTRVSPIAFTISFNESATTMTASGVAVSSGTISQITGSGAGPYIVSVLPTGQGAVGCQAVAGAVQDALGNPSTASTVAVATYDSMPPVCLSLNAPTSPTKTSPINFTLMFNESITGLTNADFTVTGGTKGAVTGSGLGPYTLPVTPSGTQGVVTCQFNVGGVLDLAGNANTDSVTASTTYDAVVPVMTVSGPATPTGVTPIIFTITASEPVTGLTTGGFNIGNGTAGTLSGSGAGPYTLQVTPIAEGNVTCRVNASAVQDLAGNANGQSNTVTIVYNAINRFFISNLTGRTVYRYNDMFMSIPSWVMNAANADPQDIACTDTNVYSLDNTAKKVYRYDLTGGAFTASKVLKDTGGAALGTLRGLATDGTDLWVADQSNKRLLVYVVASAFGAGNLNATREFNMVSGNTGAQGLAMDAASLYVLDQAGRVFYRYPRNTANNTTGIATLSAALNDSTGAPLATLTGAVLDGQTMWVVNDGATDSIHSFSLDALFATTGDLSATRSASLPSVNSASTGIALNPSPHVVSITRAVTSPTNAASVTFTVTFSEDVTGVDSSDFQVTTSGTLTGTSVTGTGGDSSNVRTVTVNTGTGSGSLRLDFVDNDSVVDIGNYPAGGTGVGNANFNTGEAYTIDRDGPIPTVSGPASPTHTSPVPFTIEFDESVTGLATNDFTLTNCDAVSLSGSGAGPYTLFVTPHGGVATCQVKASAAKDLAGNNSVISNIASVNYVCQNRFFVCDYQTGSVYRYSETGSLLTVWTATGCGDPEDIWLTGSNVYVQNGSGDNIYRFTYDGGSSTASKTLKTNTGGKIGNCWGLAIDGDDVWVLDSSNRRLMRYSLAAAFSGTGNLSALNQFSLAAGNTNGQGLAIDATYLYVLDTTGRVFYRYLRSTVNNGTGVATLSGTLRDHSGANLTGLGGAVLEGPTVWVVNDGTSQDTLHSFALADLFSTTGNVDAVTSTNLDTANTGPSGIALNSIPKVVSIARSSINPSNASSVAYHVTFSEPVTGIDPSDFNLATSGLSGASIASISADSGSTRTVTINTGTGTGALRLDFVDDDSVIDSANMPVGGVGAGNGNFTGEEYIIDRIPPTCSVTAPTSPTKENPMLFTIVFSEPVSGLTTSTIAILNGTAGSLSDLGGTTFTLAVIPAGQGLVTCQVPAGAAVDAAGNLSLESNAASSVYDSIGPDCTITGPSSPTNANPLVLTISFTEPVYNFTADKITLSGGTIHSFSGSGAAYTLEVTPGGVQGTIHCQVPGAAGRDLAGNGSNASSEAVIDYDLVAPTCTIIGPASPSKHNPLVFTIVFSEPVLGFGPAGISVTSGTQGKLSGIGNTTFTLEITPGSEGLVACQVAAAAAHDAAGNASGISNESSVIYDSIQPSVVLNTAAGAYTNAPFVVNAHFSEMYAFEGGTASITMNNATMGSLSGSGLDYHWTVQPSAQGPVTCQVAAGCVRDAAGNHSTASNIITTLFDSVPSTCTVSGPASPTKGNPIVFTIRFGEPVSGLNTAGITVGNGTKGSLSGNGAGPYTLQVTPSGQGAVTCQVQAGAASDPATNGNTISNEFSLDYDSVLPVATVTGITSPTRTSPLHFTINFTEPVTGLSAAGFDIGNGTAGALSGNGTGPYILEVNPAGEGAVTCKVKKDAAFDTAENGNDNSNEFSIIYDSVAPTCAVSGPATPTRISPLTFKLGFSEAVDGLTTAGITLSGATSCTLTADSASTYTLRVVPSGQGTVTCQVNGGVAQDAAGNVNEQSNSVTVNYDSVAPTIQVMGPVSPARISPLVFKLACSEAVQGLTPAGITVTGGTVSLLTADSASSYTLQITPIGQGEVTCQANAGAAQDAAGNQSPVSNLVSVTFDPIEPTVVVTGPTTPTNAKPILFTISFSKAVSGLTADAITVGNGSKGVLSGSGATYTLPVTPAGQGAVTCQVSAGAAHDTAGNGNLLSNLASATYDTIAPTVTVAGPATATNANPILFTINFSEPVSGLTAGEIEVGNGTRGALSGSGASYTLQVTPAGQGAVTCQVDDGVAQDAAGNGNLLSNLAMATYDTIAPTVTVAGPATATNANPILFTINFSEPVSGLTAGEIEVGNGTRGALSGSGASYTLAVTPSAQGAVTCRVPAGVATDAAANGNHASYLCSVIYDSIAPAATITLPDHNPSAATSYAFNVHFSESVEPSFGDSDVSIAGTLAVSSLEVSEMPGANNYRVTVALANPHASGDLGIVIGSGVQDPAGNALPGAASERYTVDHSIPGVAIGAPTAAIIRNGPVSFPISYTGATSITLSMEHVILLTTGSLTADVAVSGTGTANRTVTLNNVHGDGKIGIRLAGGTATNGVGTLAGEANCPACVMVDNTAPGITISAPSTASTTTGPVTFTITYAGASAITLSDSDIIVNKSHYAYGKASVSGSGPNQRTVTISSISGNGVIGISLAGSTASDDAGNLAEAAGPSQTFTVTTNARSAAKGWVFYQ